MNHPSQVINSNSIKSDIPRVKHGNNTYSNNFDNSIANDKTDNDSNSNLITEDSFSKNSEENPSSSSVEPMDIEIYRAFINKFPPIITDLTQDFINFLEAIKINLNIKLTDKLIYRHLKLYTDSEDFHELNDYLLHNGVAYQAISPLRKDPAKLFLRACPTTP